MTRRDPLLRSWLYVPGHIDRFLTAAQATDADAVIIDLEDAVPAADKPRARAGVADAVAGFAGRGISVWVRVNPVGSAWWADDVAAATAAGVDGIRLPKVDGADDVRATAEQLDACERSGGRAAGGVRIVPGIESAAGVAAASEIARASDRVQALAFGAADFCADLGVDISWEATLVARSMIVLDSRRAGIAPPVDGAYTALEDADGLLSTTLAARSLGFFGRSAIHPRQVEVINRAYTPSVAEVDRARAILDAAGDGGAARVGSGEFADAAIVRRARQVVALADRHAGEGAA